MAGEINTKCHCHQTVPTDFGSKCWLLVRKLILNKLTNLLGQFPRELNQCSRVDLVASCYQQLTFQIKTFQAIENLTEKNHCTYRCVTKQEEWHLLLERLELNQVTSSDVNFLLFSSAEL